MICNKLTSLWKRLYDRTVGYSKDCTWWWLSKCILSPFLNLVPFHLLAWEVELPLTGCTIGHYWFLDIFFFCFEVFASLGWPRKYQLDVSLITWTTANWFARFIQEPCYIILMSLKMGKIFRKPWGKNNEAKTETVKSVKISKWQGQCCRDEIFN